MAKSRKRKDSKDSKDKVIHCQIPALAFSIIEEMIAGRVKPFYAFVQTLLNIKSRWENGASHPLSYGSIAKLVRHTSSYVGVAIRWLEKQSWCERKNAKHEPGIYQLKPHNCEPDEIPLDGDGRPYHCAVPFSEGSVIRTFFNGLIGWKSVLLWIVLKFRSDWTNGITDPLTILEIRKMTRFSTKTICDSINSLVEAGLIEKLPRKRQNVATVYRLLPEPNPKTKRTSQYRDYRTMKRDDEWTYSYNELCRIHHTTNERQIRDALGNKFRKMTDHEWYNVIPKSLREDFERIMMVRESIHDDPIEVEDLAPA